MDLASTVPPAAPGAALADDELLAARARNDRSAFAELYVRNRELVFGYLRARTGTDDDAVELTAITFERALVAIDRYAPRGAGVRAWLLRIARNAAIDEARRRQRSGLVVSQVTPAAEPAASSPEADLLVAEDAAMVRRALMALREEERDALGLRFGAGLTAREIGAVLGKREAATQKLIERAVARLREVLA